MPLHDDLLQEFQTFAKTAPSTQSIMEHIAQRLHEKMTRYNWVGFYLVDPADPNVLLVGPFVGSFTPNARIPLSSGLCGAAARTGETVVVHDVSKDPRYLAGSPMVKCEIVVPIFEKEIEKKKEKKNENKKLIAEFDIESYFSGTFTPADQRFVEACALLVGKSWGKG
jgi:L-methionine (R)-S-oxide reductase